MRAITAAMLVVLATAAVSCAEGASAPALRPAPVQVIEPGKVASVQGHTIMRIDGVAVEVPEVLPRLCVQMPGLMLADAEAMEGGVAFAGVCGENPRRVVRVYRSVLIESGWTQAHEALGDNVAQAVYRSGGWVAHVAARMEQDVTRVTLHVEPVARKTRAPQAEESHE